MDKEPSQRSPSPYEDPELLARAQGDNYYLNGLVAAEIARLRLEAVSTSGTASDEEVLTARQRYQTAKQAAEEYAREKGLLPSAPEEET